MLRASRIESRSTAGTHVPTAHVLVDRQLGTAPPAENSLGMSLMLRPDEGSMVGKGIVAAYASIILLTALVFDGDDVSFGVPVSALCQGTDIDTPDWRLSRWMWMAIVSC